MPFKECFLCNLRYIGIFTATIIVAKEEPLSERVVSQSELRLIETEIPELKSTGSTCTLESGVRLGYHRKLLVRQNR
jgi:hypothetical protein